MDILKEYIRQVVKRYLNEQSSSTPRLPVIPAATGGGAVPQTTGPRINSARVKFAQTAINTLNQYRTQSAQAINIIRQRVAYNQNPANDPNILSLANHINDIATQINTTIQRDTNNWQNVPDSISTELDALRPENSALKALRDNTNWGEETTAQNRPSAQDLLTNFNSIATDNIPRIIASLQAYLGFYSR